MDQEDLAPPGRPPPRPTSASIQKRQRLTHRSHKLVWKAIRGDKTCLSCLRAVSDHGASFVELVLLQAIHQPLDPDILVSEFFDHHGDWSLYWLVGGSCLGPLKPVSRVTSEPPLIALQ